MNNVIKKIDVTKINAHQYLARYAGCLILTHDHKILLQQRGKDWDHYPGYISEFGGPLEKNETPIQALIRELNEELGAIVKEPDVITIGAITQINTNQNEELVYLYFWHDKHASITGCYEGVARLFNNTQDVLAEPNLMATVRLLLREAEQYFKPLQMG